MKAPNIKRRTGQERQSASKSKGNLVIEAEGSRTMQSSMTESVKTSKNESRHDTTPLRIIRTRHKK